MHWQLKVWRSLRATVAEQDLGKLTLKLQARGLGVGCAAKRLASGQERPQRAVPARHRVSGALLQRLTQTQCEGDGTFGMHRIAGAQQPVGNRESIQGGFKRRRMRLATVDRPRRIRHGGRGLGHANRRPRRLLPERQSACSRLRVVGACLSGQRPGIPPGRKHANDSFVVQRAGLRSRTDIRARRHEQKTAHEQAGDARGHGKTPKG